MKKIFFMLLTAIAFVGCQDSYQNIEGGQEAVAFSIGGLTKAQAEMKDSWNIGDKVAIFRANSSGDVAATAAPLVYKVTDVSGTLDAVGDCYYANQYDNFVAIYPYFEGYSYGDYDNYIKIEDKPKFSDIDILKATTTVDSDIDAELQFSHVFARMEITITGCDENDTEATINIEALEIAEKTFPIEKHGSAGIVATYFMTDYNAPVDPEIEICVNSQVGPTYDINVKPGKNYKFTVDLN